MAPFSRGLSWLLVVALLATETSSAPRAIISDASSAPLGLPADAIRKNGIFCGFLPDWTHESPRDVNRRLGAPVAVLGDYQTISSSDTSLWNLESHGPAVRFARNGTVYAPAVLPLQPLDELGAGWADALAGAAKRLNDAGVTVWLRFAYEMNGDWMSYGLQPAAFVEAWRNVTAAVRAAGAGETFMLWSPNVYGGDDAGDPAQAQGYAAYWPGAEYVDLAGLSFYWNGEHQTENTLPGETLFASLFQQFYDLYGPQVPVVISETSAPFHYVTPSSLLDLEADSEIPDSDYSSLNLSTLTPQPGGADELAMKSNWTGQLLAPENAGRWPNLLAVSFFNYLKIGNASGAQLDDYRAVGGDAGVEAWYRGFVGNQTAYDEGWNGKAGAGAGVHKALAVLGASAALLGMYL